MEAEKLTAFLMTKESNQSQTSILEDTKFY